MCLKFGLKFWIFRTKEPLSKNPLTHIFNPHAQIILKSLERTKPRNVALYLYQIFNIKNNQFSLIQPLQAWPIFLVFEGHFQKSLFSLLCVKQFHLLKNIEKQDSGLKCLLVMSSPLSSPFSTHASCLIAGLCTVSLSQTTRIIKACSRDIPSS